ncbi:MAG TPA: gephyrin-like molybdotransferase Glp [Gammaproteobacteria bacterium]|nr:gephyrin-like molybdotransferase Glp [Gammaproteobacteria bacterium]
MNGGDSNAGVGAGTRLSVEQARERTVAAVAPVSGHERVPLSGALGRVLHADITAPADIPAFAASAMDGYALRAADLPGRDAEPRGFPVIGAAFAGAPFDGRVGAGECVRIMTGAPMPEGVDTVVIQEDVERSGDRALVGSGHVAGQHVRAPGEDVAAGSRVLPAGRRLRPADLGMLAGVGLGEVDVRRRARVAYFSTGDELVEPGGRLRRGDIYERNRYTIGAMLERLGVEARDLGIVPDDRDAIRDTMLRAAEADAVITSGGVSVGEADYVRELLEEVGEVDFWRVSVKPGKPLAVGTVRGARFYGLPGNPVSSMVTFYLFVRPALERMSGTEPVMPATWRVRCAERLRKQPGRTDFQRGILERDGGEPRVRPMPEQGSSILSSMSGANCFIVVPAEAGDVEAGTLVDVIPFDETL